jgi:hypothetical protein
LKHSKGYARSEHVELGRVTDAVQEVLAVIAYFNLCTCSLSNSIATWVRKEKVMVTRNVPAVNFSF